MNKNKVDMSACEALTFQSLKRIGQTEWAVPPHYSNDIRGTNNQESFSLMAPQPTAMACAKAF